jgi:cell division protein FtsI/penicillin-binding protein 2
LNIKGIHIGEKPIRYYPFGSMGSSVLGFVSQGKGQYGVESYYEEELGGVPGKLTGKDVVFPEDGKDIRLNIDQNIQTEAEKIIGDLVPKWGATSGQIIVMDPHTGAVIAMTSFPSYDPNSYGKYDLSSFINQGVQAVYEPGSVFKLITIAAGIDAGKITPQTTYMDNGFDIIDGWKIRDWDHQAHGLTTMAEVINDSLNLGTIFAEKKMGNDVFLDYVRRFNMDKKTGIELPAEAMGDIKSIINGSAVNYATASFGQGVAVTPIRMLEAVNAIANDGVIMKAHLSRDAEPEVDGTPISKETATTMTKILIDAVDKNTVAHIPDYAVAGKTGTAYIPDFKKGGYTNDVVNTYVGFAPAYSPRFSVLVRLDAPKGNPLAGQTVVPAFRDLAEFIIDYYNIAPDRPGK